MGLDALCQLLDASQIDDTNDTAEMETKGAKLDAEGRALLEEDLRPVYEEIAVFQRFSRIIREAHKKFVVMDTAPTGHTLILIDATGAYHRRMARQLDKGKALITPPR